jgi:hypothetical protein
LRKLVAVLVTLTLLDMRVSAMCACHLHVWHQHGPFA